MKKIYSVIFVLLLFLVVSCKKENNDSDDLSLSLKHFAYVDDDGNDLLNNNNPNVLDFNTMRLYYINNGIKEEVINNHSITPRNIALNCSDDLPRCVLGILLSDTTVLEIGYSISDTICLENDGQIIRYNGEVVWDSSKDSYNIPIATIVK